MTMTEGYLNAIATAGGALITHIGLVDETDTEVVDGTYARLPITWTAAAVGTIRPTADLTFSVPAGTVGGWRGFSALTAGINYGGQDLTNEIFAAAGQYKLLAAGTGILHS